MPIEVPPAATPAPTHKLLDGGVEGVRSTRRIVWKYARPVITSQGRADRSLSISVYESELTDRPPPFVGTAIRPVLRFHEEFRVRTNTTNIVSAWAARIVKRNRSGW